MLFILESLSTKDLPILKMLYYAKQIISIILIIVPVILIVMGTIDLVKLLIDNNKQSEAVSKMIKKLMYGVIIFFIPILVNFVTAMVGYNLEVSNMWTNSNKEMIDMLETQKKQEDEARKKIVIENKKARIKREKEEKQRIKAEIEELLKKEAEKAATYPSGTDPDESSLRNQIADFGAKHVGLRYVWGGTSLTSGADCSGFVQQIYKNFGISISRTTTTQINDGRAVPLSQLRKGDLVFYSAPSRNHHVGMYIGGGKIVHAKGTKWGVVIDNVNYGSPLKGVSIVND